MNKIVLIGGMGRSGTNLVRRIIGSHSKIAMPPVELKFFSGYKKGKSVKEILSNEVFIRRFGLDVSDLYNQEPKEAFVNTLKRHAESVGKEIAGEKTPGNEFHYNLIQEWLCDFDIKFIHIFRNPIDVMASFKHASFRADMRKKDNSYRIAALSKQWCRSLTLGLARAYVNSRGYYILKFEDLTNDSNNVVRKLCDFLDVDFEQERMLNLTDFSNHRDNSSFPETNEEERQNHGRIRPLASRKNHLTESELRIVGSICGEIAEALGYEDDDYNAFLSTYRTPIMRFKETIRKIERFVKRN